jgi:hypothetical protein
LSLLPVTVLKSIKSKYMQDVIIITLLALSCVVQVLSIVVLLGRVRDLEGKVYGLECRELISRQTPIG